MPVRGVHRKDSRALDMGLHFPGTKRTRTPCCRQLRIFQTKREHTFRDNGSSAPRLYVYTFIYLYLLCYIKYKLIYYFDNAIKKYFYF